MNCQGLNRAQPGMNPESSFSGPSWVRICFRQFSCEGYAPDIIRVCNNRRDSFSKAWTDTPHRDHARLSYVPTGGWVQISEETIPVVFLHARHQWKCVQLYIKVLFQKETYIGGCLSPTLISYPQIYSPTEVIHFIHIVANLQGCLKEMKRRPNPMQLQQKSVFWWW